MLTGTGVCIVRNPVCNFYYSDVLKCIVLMVVVCIIGILIILKICGNVGSIPGKLIKLMTEQCLQIISNSAFSI